MVELQVAVRILVVVVIVKEVTVDVPFKYYSYAIFKNRTWNKIFKNQLIRTESEQETVSINTSGKSKTRLNFQWDQNLCIGGGLGSNDFLNGVIRSAIEFKSKLKGLYIKSGQINILLGRNEDAVFFLLVEEESTASAFRVLIVEETTTTTTSRAVIEIIMINAKLVS